QHSSVAVETDDRPVRTFDVLGDPHDHGLHNVALFHTAARDRFLHRDDNHIADRGVFALRAAKHFDAHDSASTGIVGNIEIGLHLNHGEACLFSPRTTAQRLSLEIGRCSSIHTISPTLNSFFSSCA